MRPEDQNHDAVAAGTGGAAVWVMVAVAGVVILVSTTVWCPVLRRLGHRPPGPVRTRADNSFLTGVHLPSTNCEIRYVGCYDCCDCCLFGGSDG